MEEVVAKLFSLIFHSFHPSEAEFLRCEVVSLTLNPQPGGPGYPSSSGSYPFTCPAWVPLLVATLPPA
jgi:hypothetical protein